jgi:heat shock protein HslJ
METRLRNLVVVLSALVAACQTPARVQPTAPLAGTSWVASTMDDAPLAAGEPPTLAFGDDHRVSGDTGCNRYMGPFLQEGASLRFGDLASTRMACVAEDRAKQEIRLLAILRGATEGQIEDGKLIVRGPTGRIVFERASR